jgi:hypothetical protein
MFKYIRTKQEGFILWSARDLVTHAEMARKLCKGRDDTISAGFVSHKLECFGESLSLGLSSLPSDTEDLTRQLDTGFIN